VKEVSHVIEGLRPMTLDDFGLTAAVRQQVEGFRKVGFEIGYQEVLGKGRLPPQAETTLYRVAREALNNMKKHAHTTKVRVKLARLSRQVRLEDTDEGCGFDPSAVSKDRGPGEGVSLASMRERGALVGGELRITSELDAGTSLLAEIPLTVPGKSSTEYGL
jgi:signal transduction histidine kinase